jgi:hypothetical protein
LVPLEEGSDLLVFADDKEGFTSFKAPTKLNTLVSSLDALASFATTSRV